MGIRTAVGLCMLAGLMAGCGDEAGSVVSSETPAASAVVDDASLDGPPIPEEDRGRLADIALALDGLPSDADVVRFEPAFDEGGSLSGAVVVLRHASYSGSVDLPGLDLMEADGREIAVPQVVRYNVDSAVAMHVAVDLATHRVLWATPGADSVTATEVVSRSDVDIDGRPVPPDARQLEGA